MGKKNREKNIKPVMKQEFIEIRDGELYLKIPKNASLDSIIRVLVVLEKSFGELQTRQLAEPEPEPAKEEEISVTAEPQIDEFMTRCPKCNSKLKSKVKKRGNELVRIVRCKKNKRFRKKCDFIHEFSIKV